MNLLLWGSENWSGNSNNLILCEGFHHKAIHRILGISMQRVMDERIRNEKVRKKFGGIASFTEIWQLRQLLFLGRIVRLKEKYPPILLTATVDGSKRSRGRLFRTIRDAFIDNLMMIIPNIDKRGKTNDWIGYALDKKEWIRMVKEK